MPSLTSTLRSFRLRWPQVRWQWFFWILGGLLLAPFTFWPNSYGLMVRWPWVMVWQLGFWAIALGCTVRLWRLRQPFRLLGHQLDWAAVLMLLALIFSTLFAFQPEPSAWYLVMTGGYGVLLYALVNLLGGDRPLTPDAPPPPPETPDAGEAALPEATTELALSAPLAEPESGQRRWWLLRGVAGLGAVTSIVSLVLWGLNFANLSVAANPYPFGHPEFVAGYGLLVLPWVGAIALGEIGRWRWLGLGGIALTLIMVGTTGSWAAGLVLLVLLIGGAIALGQRYRSLDLSRSAWMAGILASLAAIAAVLLHPRVQIWTLLQPQSPLRLELLQRGLLAQTAWDLWRDHLWFGAGLGNTIRLFNLYRPIEAGPTLIQAQQFQSLPLQILAELGLVGVVAIALSVGLLGRLVWHLAGRFQGRDRLIFWACTKSLLIYGLFSLSDFQLENIGISLTLTAAIALLVSLAHTVEPPPVVRVPLLRRYLGAIGIILLVEAAIVWLPVDRAMGLGRLSFLALQQQDVTTFEQWGSAATGVTPWDPTYEFHLGTQLARLAKTDDPAQAAIPNAEVDPQLARQLAEARLHLEQAVGIAPSDPVFNEYAGALLLEADAATAARYLRHTAQLIPRTPYLYGMLGTAYMYLNNSDNAIKAFALEGLINPAFLTTQLWQREPLDALLPRVAEATLKLYDQAIAQMPTQTPGAIALQHNQAALRWWLSPVLPEALKSTAAPSDDPLLALVRQIDQGQESAAIAQLKAPQALGGDRASQLLLQAWLQPANNAVNLLQQANLYPPLAREIRPLLESLSDRRNFRDWLRSLHGWVPADPDWIGVFSYRNTNGPLLTRLPRSLPENLLVTQLGLFRPVPVAPAFDRALVQAQQQTLNLQRPRLRRTLEAEPTPAAP